MTRRIRPDLVLANFGELGGREALAAHPGPRPLGSLWQRAALIPDAPGYVLVAPARPSEYGWPPEVWSPPDTIIVPQRRSGRLCDDLLDDGAAWAALCQALGCRVPVRIWAQVFSPGVVAVIEALTAAGVAIDLQELPRVSPYTVAWWNTKIGGRELLQSVPALRPALPAAMMCRSLPEVLQALAEFAPERGLVVKADASIGGAGVWMFPRGIRIDPESVALRLAGRHPDQRRPAPSKAPGSVSGPYLLEELVGTPGRVLSPTADFYLWNDGGVECLGIGIQALAGSVQYHGVRSLLPAERWLAGPCTELGKQIGGELHRRGYRGLVNVDFIAAEDRQVWVAEMNIRQSAPLDQFLIVERLRGAEWSGGAQAFLCDESVICDLPADELPLALPYPESSEALLLPLSATMDSSSQPPLAALLSIAPTLAAAAALLDTARATLADAGTS